jgi:hypothetical protein
MSGSADGTGWTGVTVLRDATFGIVPPPGGGLAVFGFNSLQKVDASVCIYTQVAGFSPMASGGQIKAAIQKGISGGNTGFSNFIFLCASGSDVGDVAYLLGVEDSTPGRLVLVKGVIGVGIPADGSGTQILRASSQRYVQGDWIHLRLDAIVQASGDVVLRCYTNDLTLHPLNLPAGWVWEPIVFSDGWVGVFNDGYFIDDVIGVNSGSLPRTNGFAGFGFKCTESARRAYIDHIDITQQA